MIGTELCLWCSAPVAVCWETFCCDTCKCAALLFAGHMFGAKRRAKECGIEWQDVVNQLTGATWFCAACGSRPVKNRGNRCPECIPFAIRALEPETSSSSSS